MTNATTRREASLPSVEEMYQAIHRRDHQYEGVFFFGVRTTGVFCRPSCSARTPRLENVNFYRWVQDALAAGFRPCRKCRPQDLLGNAPEWLDRLLEQMERSPDRRWSDAEICHLGVAPVTLRRWFKQQYGITFQQYLRSQRLARALEAMHHGRQATGAAVDAGYESASAFNQAFRKWSGVSPGRSNGIASPIVVNRMLTPLGPMVAAVVDQQLCLLEFVDRKSLPKQFERLGRIYPRPMVHSKHDLLQQVQIQLTEYFDGLRRSFDLPLAIAGSEFQTAVWRALMTIPYGVTASYDAIARSIDRPGAQRAVGRANGENRIAILIPCHRVIRSDGQLSGYGGQVWRKRWLLEHEQRPTAESTRSPNSTDGVVTRPGDR